MKKLLKCGLLIGLAALAAIAADNDFYNDSPPKDLGQLTLAVAGEVTRPGPVDLAALPLRSVIVREAVFEGGGTRFVGAYRYDGYSLFDILKDTEVAKKNQAEFSSVIDLVVTVENARGDKVVLSWGEIFYPAALHRIIIATRVAPIIPSKTKEQWPLPTATRLVCANDLVSVRTVDSPTRITVQSCPRSFPVDRSVRLYSPKVQLAEGGQAAGTVQELPTAGEWRTFPSVFYGRGMGFHGVEQFRGKLLSEALKGLGPATLERCRTAYFVLVGCDGYRAVVSYSELFNRNDGAEFLLVDRGKDSSGGRFSVFPAADFFSDRAVKALAGIYLLHPAS